MVEVLFQYRSRVLDEQHISFVQGLISKHYVRGRSYISRILCRSWQWVRPNGELKECAARDLLLGMEEKGFIELPPRLRPKNNLKRKCFRADKKRQACFYGVFQTFDGRWKIFLPFLFKDFKKLHSFRF